MATKSPSVPLSILSNIGLIGASQGDAYIPPAGYTRVSSTDPILSGIKLKDERAGYDLQVFRASGGQYIITGKPTVPDMTTTYGNATLFADRQILNGDKARDIDALEKSSFQLNTLVAKILRNDQNAEIVMPAQSLAAAQFAYFMDKFLSVADNQKYRDNLIGIGFNTPALRPSTLEKSSYVDMNFTTIASWTDPVVATTLYNGGVLPGKLYYVDAGANLNEAKARLLSENAIGLGNPLVGTLGGVGDFVKWISKSHDGIVMYDFINKPVRITNGTGATSVTTSYYPVVYLEDFIRSNGVHQNGESLVQLMRSVGNEAINFVYGLNGYLRQHGMGISEGVDLPDCSFSPYTIQAGDTLEKIAVGTGFSVKELAEFNAINDPDKIYVGAVLSG